MSKITSSIKREAFLFQSTKITRLSNLTQEGKDLNAQLVLTPDQENMILPQYNSHQMVNIPFQTCKIQKSELLGIPFERHSQIVVKVIVDLCSTWPWKLYPPQRIRLLRQQNIILTTLKWLKAKASVNWPRTSRQFQELNLWTIFICTKKKKII